MTGGPARFGQGMDFLFALSAKALVIEDREIGLAVILGAGGRR
ncbi:hypothetical protein [Noviherbaspirillum album]|nr:hypothetical protein [Noviherbaspirillum sp. CPCC 100848]